MGSAGTQSRQSQGSNIGLWRSRLRKRADMLIRSWPHRFCSKDFELFFSYLSPTGCEHNPAGVKAEFKLHETDRRANEGKQSIATEGRPATDETDALRHVRHGVLPVVLVLNRDVAIEPLGLEFVQTAFDVGDTPAVDGIGQTLSNLGAFLQVAADDATLEDAQALDRLKTGRCPVAGVGAGANARVTILDQRQHIFRVPDPVGSVLDHAAIRTFLHPLAVFMDADLDVE